MGILTTTCFDCDLSLTPLPSTPKDIVAEFLSPPSGERTAIWSDVYIVTTFWLTCSLGLSRCQQDSSMMQTTISVSGMRRETSKWFLRVPRMEGRRQAG